MKNRLLSTILLILILYFSYCLSVGTRPSPIFGVTGNYVSEWKGIKPGISSMADVIGVLGLPDNIHLTKFSNRFYIKFSYNIKEKIFNDELKDKYYFDINGRLRWITIPFTDRNQKIHMLSDENRILDKTPDTIYWNNNINSGIIVDLHSGPDQVYVWSSRGIALLGIPGCYSNNNIKISCDLRDESIQTKNSFSPAHGPLYELMPIDTDQKALLIFEVIFPSTTYESFIENYSSVIPFWGEFIWDRYIEKYK